MEQEACRMIIVLRRSYCYTDADAGSVRGRVRVRVMQNKYQNAVSVTPLVIFSDTSKSFNIMK